jgi:hypothetical protein
LDVNPGAGVDLRTVADGGIGFTTGSGGLDGRGASFSDTGFLVYRLSFTDGSSGVFVSQLTPVPEPGAVLGLAAAGLLAGRWVRRRVADRG